MGRQEEQDLVTISVRTNGLRVSCSKRKMLELSRAAEAHRIAIIRADRISRAIMARPMECNHLVLAKMQTEGLRARAEFLAS